jgi:beta-lactamase regulating signal transducer with metallopeptidase domain
MNFVLSVIAKTTIMLACASLMTLALRRASASARHAVWAIVLLGALILPFAAWILPEVSLPVLPLDGLRADELAPVSQSIGPIPHVPAPRSSGLAQVRPLPSSSSVTLQSPAEKTPNPIQSLIKGHPILLIWAMGASLVLFRLILGSVTIRRLRRQSTMIKGSECEDVVDDLRATLRLKRPVTVRVANQTIPPMTWGIFRPVVLLPATAVEWTEGRRRIVLAHELAHVKRNDGLLQVLLQAVCSLYWFNPIVWYAARRLRIERECACDDQVLKLGADADDYADHLLQVARTLNPGSGISLATVAMAHRSQLETRLLSILDNRTRRQNISRAISGLLLSGVTLVTLAVAALQITAMPSSLPLDLDPLVPGIPADFGVLADTEQIPAVVRGWVREFGSETPIAGALLALSPLEAEPEGSAADDAPRYEIESHSDGTFSLKDVPPGQYRLNLFREGYVGTHSTAEPARLTVFNGQPPEDLHLHLMRGPAISGRIFDESGKLRPLAHVELLRMEFREGQPILLASDISMVTDKNGEYRLPGLPSGEYYLRVRPRAGAADFLPVYFPGVTDSTYATPITVRNGADISGIDLSLTRGNLHSVRLTVDIAAPAPANPELSFYITPKRSGGSAAAGAVQFHSAGRNAYVSPLLAPGSYEIEVYLRDPDPIRWAHTSVEIDNRDVDAGNLVIGPGVWIQGHITAAESLPVGVRRGQLLVTLRPLDGSIFLVPSAQVADDGSFVIPRVPERRFRVDLTGLPPEVYLSSARFGGREVLNAGFMVSNSGRSGLDLSIASSGGVVAGVVRNAQDEPISNGIVVLMPPNKQNLRTASTDRFGVFSITGVPPGEYGVLAWTDGRSKAYLDPLFLTAVENQATKVVVQRGFTNTINVRAIAP